MRIRGTVTKGLLVALILTLIPVTAFSAQKITPGSICKVSKQKITFQGKIYTCVKSGKKLVWNKGVAVKPILKQEAEAKAAAELKAKQEAEAKAAAELKAKQEAEAKAAATPTPAWFSKVEAITPNELFSYQSFDNKVIQLYPWEGKKVVLLTVSKNLDPLIMGKILTALDLSYATYNELTNFTPVSAKSYNGKLLIAEIPQNLKNCGAGCGYLGATGIQIYENYFLKLYEGVKNKNQFDQVLFYELGRNFWNYSSWNSKLAFKENDSVVTGFAVLMRFVTMAENDIPLSDFNSYTGEEFLETVKNLATVYLGTSKFAFSNTFAIQKSPGALGTTDLWASIMMDFAKRYGEKIFYTEFFKSIQTLPQVNTTLEAVKNWETALSKATKTDVSNEFINTWKMYK